MANQNFRVKKGLEVGSAGTFLYADDQGVGINSIQPRSELDVRGLAYISDLEVGPATRVGYGLTALVVNGNSFFDGDIEITGDLSFDDATVDNLSVAGIATINQLEFGVGIGSTLRVGILTAEYFNATGVSTFEDDLWVKGSVAIGNTLFVKNNVVIGGGITFQGDVTIEIDVEVEGNINQNPSGIATFGTINFNTGVGTDLTVVDLTVTGEADINGAGIATIGGDPLFNSLSVTGFSTFGGLNTTGFSTFYQNLKVTGDLSVDGDIGLDDLVADTISVNRLDYNSGFGTNSYLGFASITDAEVGIATINELYVTDFAVVGSSNTTGFSTFNQNVRIDGDLEVGGDISLDDLDSGNISVGGTVTTDGLVFNVGLGTTAYIGFASIRDADIGIATVRELDVTDFLTVGSGSTTGISTFYNDVRIEKDLDVQGDITVDAVDATTISVGTTLTTDDLVFNVGFGSTAYIGLASITDAKIGVATVGILSVSDYAEIGIANTTGISTIHQDLRVKGDLKVSGDIVLDDLTAGNISVAGTIFTDGIDFNVGFGTTAYIGFLSATDAKIGVATVGELDVTNFAEIGTANTTGISTVHHDLRVKGDLKVSGDIVLDDLTAGNISVAGTIFADGIDFNVGFGTTAYLGFASITEATIDAGTVGLLTVTDYAQIGTGNSTGITTVYQNLNVTGDLSVNGDIGLDDLVADTISVGSTLTTDDLVFNVGVGTTLVVTGIISAREITGIGSQLLDLPSATTYVGPTTAPSTRSNGDDLQSGDLWFDSAALRQFTYYVDVDSAQWIDSNPPPLQGALNFVGNYGEVGEVGLDTSVFNILGITSETRTKSGIGNTIVVGLDTNIYIENNLLVGGMTTITGVLETLTDVTIGGSVAIGDTLFVASDVVVGGGITFQGDVAIEVDIEVIGNLNVNGITTVTDINFEVGTGTTLNIQDINATGDIEINGVGVATLGSDATFRTLGVSSTSAFGQNFSTGVSTFFHSLDVKGDLDVTGDLKLDDIVSGGFISAASSIGAGTTVYTEDLEFTGLGGGSLDIGSIDVDELTVNTRVVDKLTIRGAGEIVLDAVTDGRETINVGDNATIIGADIGGALPSKITIEQGQFNESILVGASGTSRFNGVVEMPNKLEVGEIIGNGVVSFAQTVTVTGPSTITGDVEFLEAEGYELTVERLIVPSGGFVDLPGIPVQGGVGTFRALVVTGDSAFIGFSSFKGDIEVTGILTATTIDAANIQFEGGTGIGSDSIETESFKVTGLSTFTGLADFNGNVDISDDLVVNRNLVVNGITTTGILSATNAVIGIATVGLLSATNSLVGFSTVGILTVTSAVINDLLITGDLTGSSGEAIIIDGNTNITGIVTIGNNSITIDGRSGREQIEIGTGSGDIIAGVNTFTDTSSYISLSEGRFSDFVLVGGGSSLGISTFSNSVSIGGSLTVDDLNVTGQIDVSGDIGVSGDISLNNINVSGIATVGVLTATDAYIGVATVGFISATNASVAGIITAENFNSLSDRRIKENIRVIENPLEKISQLNGVYFDFINSNNPSMGVIAQEVEEVFPELIAGKFPKSVNYNGLIGVLIESVKELKDENDLLKARLDKLES